MATALLGDNLSDSDSSDEDSWIEDDDENGSVTMKTFRSNLDHDSQ